MKSKPKAAPEPEFDKNGYPTSRTLVRLKHWKSDDVLGALKFMQAAWHSTGSVSHVLSPEEAKIVFADDGYLYFRFATGGWSGNEDLISYFVENEVCWAVSWCMDAIGGLHIFKVKKD